MMTQCPTCNRKFNDEYFLYHPCPAHPPIGGEGTVIKDAIDREAQARADKMMEVPSDNWTPYDPNKGISAVIQKIWNNKLIVPHSRKYRRVALEWLRDMAPGTPFKKCCMSWYYLTISLILQILRK